MTGVPRAELAVTWLTDRGKTTVFTLLKTKEPWSVPLTALTQEETAALLDRLDNGEVKLIARLLYGSGLRLLEGLRLRVTDVDLPRRELIVRDSKGGNDRVSPHTCYATPSLRICWRLVMTFLPCRRCSVIRSLRRFDDNDLHPCPQSRRSRRCQPTGSAQLNPLATPNKGTLSPPLISCSAPSNRHGAPSPAM